MKYRSHINNKKKKSKKILIILFFTVILIILFKVIPIYYFPNFFIWQNNLKIMFLDKEKIKVENIYLQQKIEKYHISTILNSYYFFENIKLREKLNYQIDLNIARKTFFVIQDEKNNLYDSLIVLDPNKILEQGDLVLQGFNFAIGRVEDLTAGGRKIKLFSGLGEKNNFLLVDSEKEIKFDIEATGQGAGILKVLIDRNIDLSENVVLKLIQGKEYLTGIFIKEEFKTQDPHRQLFFQILANPYLIRKVEVEK